MIDFLIIGGGVSGALIARELTKYHTRVMLVEKENDIGNHATLANSAIIHSGHDPEVGSLKAKLCLQGNAMYDELEKNLSVPLLRTGAYVVARNKEDEAVLDTLFARAKKNGVPSVALLDSKDARKDEVHLADDVTKVLSLPTTKVTYPWDVAIGALENAVINGADYKLNFAVDAIEVIDGGYRVCAKDGRHIDTKGIVNAAGTFADVIANMIDGTSEFTITPRRGEYFVLDKKVKGFLNHVLYPVPGKFGKGVLAVPQVHGNILLGPTSAYQDDREDTANHASDLSKVRTDSDKLLKDIPYDKVIRTFAGIRATSTHKDFYIQRSKARKHVYHVGGIDSPGLTAAPAIARYVVETLIKHDSALTMNPSFNPVRKKPTPFYEMDAKARAEAIARDPRYGNIVCKCERVTEAEIIEDLKRPCASDTIKGIKKRIRIGSGLCQGGYCESPLLKILARERGKKLQEIDYYDQDTPILMKETKVKR